MYVDEPHGAMALVAVQFEAWPLAAVWSSSSENDVHFVWNFGDEEVHDERGLCSQNGQLK